MRARTRALTYTPDTPGVQLMEEYRKLMNLYSTHLMILRSKFRPRYFCTFSSIIVSRNWFRLFKKYREKSYKWCVWWKRHIHLHLLLEAFCVLSDNLAVRSLKVCVSLSLSIYVIYDDALICNVSPKWVIDDVQEVSMQDMRGLVCDRHLSDVKSKRVLLCIICWTCVGYLCHRKALPLYTVYIYSIYEADGESARESSDPCPSVRDEHIKPTVVRPSPKIFDIYCILCDVLCCCFFIEASLIWHYIYPRYIDSW